MPSSPASSSGDGRLVVVEFTKWGDRPHYRLSMTRLGDDEHGTWLWAPAGNAVTKGGSHVFDTKEPTLALVPRRGMWNAVWWVGHAEVELYVDINTEPAWDAGGGCVSMIDLDLDVVRFCDGRVEIVDQDEFDEHRVAYGYPPAVVDATLAAAEEVHALVSARTEPFGGAVAQRWLATSALLRD